MKSQHSKTILVLALLALVVMPAEAKKLKEKWNHFREKHIDPVGDRVSEVTEAVAKPVREVRDEAVEFVTTVAGVFGVRPENVNIGVGIDVNSDGETLLTDGEGKPSVTAEAPQAPIAVLPETVVFPETLTMADLNRPKLLDALWPLSHEPIYPPNGTGEIRNDAGGKGSFGARRDGGTRSHAGIDFKASVGDAVIAPVTGTVIRISMASPEPKKAYLKCIVIQNEHNKEYQAKVLYVEPGVNISPGTQVKAGQTILGVVQDLSPGYPTSVQPHVHFEIRASGKPLLPVVREVKSKSAEEQ